MRVAGDEDEVVAVSGEPADEGVADAGGGAGDECSGHPPPCQGQRPTGGVDPPGRRRCGQATAASSRLLLGPAPAGLLAPVLAQALQGQAEGQAQTVNAIGVDLRADELATSKSLSSVRRLVTTMRPPTEAPSSRVGTCRTR